MTHWHVCYDSCKVIKCELTKKIKLNRWCLKLTVCSIRKMRSIRRLWCVGYLIGLSRIVPPDTWEYQNDCDVLDTKAGVPPDTWETCPGPPVTAWVWSGTWERSVSETNHCYNWLNTPTPSWLSTPCGSKSKIFIASTDVHVFASKNNIC